MLGLARLDADRLEPSARALLERFVDAALGRARDGELRRRMALVRGQLRYDNARLPHALIVGGTALGREDDGDARVSNRSRWLGDECGLADGVLRLPGHQGRRRGEPAPGAGDEQPLDASAFVEAELAAFLVTSDPEHGARAQRAFEWFLGRNRLDRPLYDFATGGCSDGLGERRRERATRVPSRRSPSTARSSCSTRPACRVVRTPASRSRESRRMTGAGASSSTAPANPLLTAEDWPYPVNVVFNPAAAVVDGETVLLARVEALTGISHLTVARSANGVDGWRSPRSRCSRRTTGSRASSGASRMRASSGSTSSTASRSPARRTGPAGPAVYLATTKDFRPSNGTASSAPRGQERRAAARAGRRRVDPVPPADHRASAARAARSSLSRSTDLVSWSAPEQVLQPRAGAWWDSLRIGIGPPPLKTEHGWL